MAIHLKMILLLFQYQENLNGTLSVNNEKNCNAETHRFAHIKKMILQFHN